MRPPSPSTIDLLGPGGCSCSQVEFAAAGQRGGDCAELISEGQRDPEKNETNLDLDLISKTKDGRWKEGRSEPAYSQLA